MFNTIEEALASFKMGNPVLVIDDENRENEGDIIFPADAATQEKINFCAVHGRGLICIAMAEQVAQRLNLHPVTSNSKDRFSTAFYDSVDANHSFGITTGISAKERAITASLIASKESKSTDFIKPGHLFPVVAKNNGVLVRPGHTEASVDLCILTGHEPAAVMCEVMDENGNMLRREGLIAFAATHQLKAITIQQIIDYRKLTKHIITTTSDNLSEHFISLLSEANLPTSFGDFTISIYKNTLSGIEHSVLSKKVSNSKPIVRIHSECQTGDIFGSSRCDCQSQLHQSLELIEANGNGAVIYLKDQEGRGIGIGNKIAAYKLQEEGQNTYEANESLGFSKDSRTYQDAIEILKKMNLNNFQLITNNPEKINSLQHAGFTFSTLQIPSIGNPHNKKYLQEKLSIAKHSINIQ